MHRFCVPDANATGEIIGLSPEESAHAVKVLRLEAGDTVEVSNGLGGIWTAEIVENKRKRVLARLDGELPGRESPVRITIYQGLPKADKLELLAQKLTEIGVDRLVPVMMERSVVKWDKKENGKRLERLNRIAQEASKQCGRARIMEIAEPLAWKEAVTAFSRHSLMFMPWEEAAGNRLCEIYRNHGGEKDIGVLIGPEGGIDGREAREACMAGAVALSLGPRILRTETAAMVSAAVIMGLWGDL